MLILILYLQIVLLSVMEVSSNSISRHNGICDSFSPDVFSSKNVERHASNHSFPFRISLSSDVYGGQSIVIIRIEGPENCNFLVQMRSLHSNDKVGHFQMAIPQSSVRLIVCQGVGATVMSTTKPLTSCNVTFHWLPPSTDRGTLALMGIFISEGEYWIIKEEGPKLFYQKPLAQIQRMDGCVTHYDNSDLCMEDECEYHLFYELNDDRKTVKVKMRGVGTKRGIYLGMAVTSNVSQNVDDFMVVSCLFTEQGVKIGSMNDIRSLIKSRPAVDGDDREFVCRFFLSLELDQIVGTLSYLAYFWGDVNPKNGEIILPPVQSIRESFQPIIPDNTPRNSCYFKYVPLNNGINSSMCQLSSSAFFIISVLTIFLHNVIQVIYF